MVELLDENGRVFGVINIIDLLAVLLIVAVIVAGVAIVTGSNSQDDKSGESMTVTVRIEEVQPYVASAIPDEGTVSDGTVSRIVNKTVAPAEVVVTDQNGQFHVREHPRLRTVVIKVEITVTRANGNQLFEDQPVTIGRQVALDFGSVEVNGHITEIAT